jgi:hypothetical protein
LKGRANALVDEMCVLDSRFPIVLQIFSFLSLNKIKESQIFAILVVFGDRYMWSALVNAVMNLRVPYNAGKLSSGCQNFGLSNGTQMHRLSLVICGSWNDR